MSIEFEFLRSARAKFVAQKELAERAFGQLNDEQLRTALSAETNCVAVIMKHLAGNMLSRWTEFLTTDGEKTWRGRDQEFVDDFTTRDDMEAHWRSGWDCLFAALDALTPDDLVRTVPIRGQPHTVIEAIHRHLDHYGYHVGQIVLAARVLAARVLAGDDWNVLTVPRGQSEQYNREMWGK